MPFQDLISDPTGFLYELAKRAPAILLALTMHEMAHGWVAYRLGDPTAQQLGRLSLNPLRHLDPFGTLMLVLAGFGWAKPVPINPGNFRHPRRDDFLVSIAGVTVNFLLSIVGMIAMFGMVTIVMRSLPESAWLASGRFVYELEGELYAVSPASVYRYAYGAAELLIEPFLGRTWGFFYEMLVNLAFINLSLAIFNLLPIPPLDGYHVLNDLLIKKDLFASPKLQLVGRVALAALLVSGKLGELLGWALTGALEGAGRGIYALLHAAGAV